MKTKKGNVAVIALIIAVVAVSAGVFGYMLAGKKQSPVIVNQQLEDGSQQSGNVQQKACTMEAKQCPDGSYVGRSGPDCEFGKCPVALAGGYEFDMDNAGKLFTPCDESYGDVDMDLLNKTEKFYDYLKDGKNSEAIGLMGIGTESPLFDQLFSFCSSMHSVVGARAEKKGIILFTKAGNGFPSVPNQDGSYSFAFLTTNGNKIILYEKNIDHYFDGPLGSEYDKNLSSDAESEGLNRAIEILEILETENKKGIETGIFNSQSVQKEHDEFILNLK